MAKSPYDQFLDILFQYGWQIHRRGLTPKQMTDLNGEETRELFNLTMVGYEARAKCHWFKRFILDVFVY